MIEVCQAGDKNLCYFSRFYDICNTFPFVICCNFFPHSK